MTQQQLIRLATRLMRERASLPENKVGKFRIEHRNHVKGDKLSIVNMRNHLFTGLPVADYVCPGPTTIHALTENGGTWMTDLPCELVQMHNELAVHARGHVLIGGLGLGLLTRMVAAKKAVMSVTVVENSAEVIQLMKYTTYFGPKVTIVHGDIHKYAAHVVKGEFDVALLDTWQGTGEWEWQTIVVPLRRMLGPKIKKIVCWQEGVMSGQVWMGLFRAADMPADILRTKSHCHQYAFRRAVVALGLRGEPRITFGNEPKDIQNLLNVELTSLSIFIENREDFGLGELARGFLHKIGTPWWERTFGVYWDAAWKVKRAVVTNVPKVRACKVPG
jgi:hypothetical protein